MRALSLLALIVVAGCYPVRWSPDPPAGLRYGPNQRVKVFGRDSVVVWHAVVVTRDSISGIPYKQRTTCNSCRVSLPWTAVDSTLTGHGNLFADVLGGIAFTVGLLWPDHR